MRHPLCITTRVRRVALIGTAALSAAGCGTAPDATVKPAGTPAASAAPAAPPASPFVAVVERPLSASVTVQGELLPFRAVDLHARVAGYVREVRVDRGSRVRRGDVLLEMDAPELLQQRSEVQARLAASKQTAARLRAAASTAGAVAPTELESIDAVLKADEARVAALDELASYLTIRAPFDGVVAARHVHPGALAGPNGGAGGVLLRLEEHDRLRLVVSVPERYAGGTLIGRTPTFRVAAWPGETFTGRVNRNSGSVDMRTRAMLVELDVAAAAKLAPGMFADVSWPVARRAPSRLVPATALVQTGTRTYVIKLSGDTAALTTVERGLVDGDLVEVFGALTSADSVLRRGREDVAAGMPLRKATAATGTRVTP